MFEAAKGIAAEQFEDDNYQRGFEGHERLVTHHGEITGHYTDYSDMLAFLRLYDCARRSTANRTTWPCYEASESVHYQSSAARGSR